ncbi:hypothetical protein KP509_19G001800 [Ceratopteris richardii]|uniref:AAA+ ATPase domain-containing protein n=1 Tax=Ceratopteris richardii TaxID=49495 RepID=A0A8T2SI67_CERRI|nr:hypothetical protein KP509_19G001800 [Ceratopteris richardii]
MLSDQWIFPFVRPAIPPFYVSVVIVCYQNSTMYKCAPRINPTLLKRISRHASVNKLMIKREPLSLKNINVSRYIFGPKAPAFSTLYSLRKFQPSNIQPSLERWLRKWPAHHLFLTKVGTNNSAAARPARMFCGKSNGKEDLGNPESASLNSNQKLDTKDAGRASKKPVKKGISEKGVPTKSSQNGAGRSVQIQGQSNANNSVIQKQKEKFIEGEGCRIRNPARSKVLSESKSTENLEGFDRLQLLKEKLIRKLGKKWLFCDKITERLNNFPYYLNKNTRDLLLDCIAARVKNHEFSTFGECLPSSSHLICLRGPPGSEVYQEALVRAVAHELGVPLLAVDTGCLSTADLKDDAHIAGLPVDGDEGDNNGKSLSAEKKCDSQALDLAHLKRIYQMLGSKIRILDPKKPNKKFNIPRKLLLFSAKGSRKEMPKLVSMDGEDWQSILKNHLVTEREDQLKKLGKQGDDLKKFWHDLVIGDHVRYRGPKSKKENARTNVTIGEEGFVCSISESLPWKICVKFQGAAEEVFCDACELEKVNTNASDEAWLARFPELPIEAVCKMVFYRNPVIVHFPDLQQWLSLVAPTRRTTFVKRVTDLLNEVDGPVVFIASSYKEEKNEQIAAGMDLHNNRSSLPSKVVDISDDILRTFRSTVNILPPEESHHMRIWKEKLEDDKKEVMVSRNFILLKESLEKNLMKCTDVRDINTLDLQLSTESAEDVIGWARNMMLHSNQTRTSKGRLVIESRCLEKSLVRMKALQMAHEDKMSYIRSLAENEYEKSLLSSIVPAHQIGVRFDDIGALEHVKNILQDLIVLPLKRPELFRKGNLRKACKGVLLFGPPGTGKTLVAKAVATEAGANFISIAPSSITSQYYGEDEQLVKALFALAKKLSPAVIFIDEVDGLLGVRSSTEGESTRRIKNDFMAAWDGLHSNDTEQILVFATTNRPFDLDDAVVRRLPRRILVDLPNAENRVKILRKILVNEDLDNTFSYEYLASQTEGYSGSDLKNLCVAAAYIPIRELLDLECQTKPRRRFSSESIRALCMNDFMLAKAKIGPSISYDAAAMIQLRQWNEQYGEGASKSQKRLGFSQ